MASTRTKPAATAAEFACPECGTLYRFRPELAGKRIRCRKCTHVFLPDHGGPVIASGYVLPGRVVSQEQEEMTAVHNWLLPGIVLAIGTIWRFWQAGAHAAHLESVTWWQAGALVIVEWLAISVALGAAVLVAASIGLEVERLGAAVLKVVAMAVLMAAVANFFASLDRTSEDLWGMMLGAPSVLVLAFFMFAGMFKADLLEALLSAVAAMLLACGVMLAFAMTIDGELGMVLSFGRPA